MPLHSHTDLSTSRTMSKVALDDLYGDIYGDDDTEISAPAEGQAPITPNQSAAPTVVKHETHHNLPAKPGSAPASSASQQNAASLSYSAQIAQQFSAYQQMPSQERQQRPEPPRTQSTSAIPTHASGTPTYNISSMEDTVFGKKPSEMHDAGYLYHVYWSYTRYVTRYSRSFFVSCAYLSRY
ncbi:hypothetical protein K438DRAFT_2011115 [Mycena galopus ATCC 62051]|nr:hypothetical protein K438DRAFT_2011115 [Mycena galopus ATCC 62051]